MRAKLQFMPILSKYLYEFVLIVGGTLIVITQLILSNALSAIASLVVFLAASSRVLPSLIRLQGSVITLRQSQGTAQITLKQMADIEEMRNSKSKSTESNKSKPFVPEIELSNVGFSYDKQSQFRIEDISLKILPGTFVAIVGESGSGKSTFVDLMLGMNEPDTGYVTISGRPPLDAFKLWPGKIAYVPQDIAIIDGSIMQNITLRFDQPSEKPNVHDALEQASFLKDVESFQNKIDEYVGERGTKLSGGQKQRLGIARALYTEPKIIVFDEATSSLDPLTEKAVTDSIYKKSPNVTLVVIAHRLSTVRNADLVVFMDKGKIIAKGTFDEVRRKVPKFDKQAKLVNL
jgi:ATP-binding cassette subfamily C protein